MGTSSLWNLKLQSPKILFRMSKARRCGLMTTALLLVNRESFSPLPSRKLHRPMPECMWPLCPIITLMQSLCLGLMLLVPTRQPSNELDAILLHRLGPCINLAMHIPIGRVRNKEVQMPMPDRHILPIPDAIRVPSRSPSMLVIPIGLMPGRKTPFPGLIRNVLLKANVFYK